MIHVPVALAFSPGYIHKYRIQLQACSVESPRGFGSWDFEILCLLGAQLDNWTRGYRKSTEIWEENVE